MHEASARTVSIDAVAAHLGELFRPRRHHHDAPGWIARELTFSQVRLLFQLREQGPVSVSRLAESLGVSVPTASEVVDRLQRRGLVSRRHRADDRRVVECALSEPGEQLVREIAGARLGAIRQTLSVLGPDELVELDRLLRVIAERLDARPGAAIGAHDSAPHDSVPHDSAPHDSAPHGEPRRWR